MTFSKFEIYFQVISNCHLKMGINFFGTPCTIPFTWITIKPLLTGDNHCTLAMHGWSGGQYELMTSRAKDLLSVNTEWHCRASVCHFSPDKLFKVSTLRIWCLQVDWPLTLWPQFIYLSSGSQCIWSIFFRQFVIDRGTVVVANIFWITLAVLYSVRVRP